jgi:hypothetical protein
MFWKCLLLSVCVVQGTATAANLGILSLFFLNQFDMNKGEQ